MAEQDFLFVGLGNPGAEYACNRHNVGFQIIDQLATRWGVSKFFEKWQALTLSVYFYNAKVHAVKPMTYMNLSGKAVAKYYQFFKIIPDHLLVLHDDLDMKSGRVKFLKGGGNGGHNGVKSIIESIGTKDFYRLKVGIGRPGVDGVHPDYPIEKFVLSDFGEQEAAHLRELMPRIQDGIGFFLQGQIDKAMGLLNSIK